MLFRIFGRALLILSLLLASLSLLFAFSVFLDLLLVGLLGAQLILLKLLLAGVFGMRLLVQAGTDLLVRRGI